jgi:Na+-translocating ferredoxin:NAD+ oxidoreductase RnfG subunit
VGLSIVLCSNILVHASAGMTATLSRSSAQALAGQAAIEQQSVAGNARRVTYFRVLDAGGKTTGYIFSSEDFAPQVRGFGGRMNLAVYIDDSGKLINFHIVRSNETPAYLEMLSDWWERLKHRPLFGRQSFSDVQAVTGATISSKAVMEALQLSAQKFAAESLGLNIEASGEPAVQKASAGLDPAVPYLVFVFVLSLLVIYWGGFWSRLAVLTFNLVVGGIILNAQFSTEQVMTLLSLQSPAVGLSAAFLLMAAMPIAILLAGNIYCGYLCPFGALQELLGYIVPARFKPALSRRDMKKPRFAKYVMLWVLVMLFFVLRRRTVLEADPLIAVFSLRLHAGDIGPILAVILGVAVVGSLFYERFWCRYLCPAGAFLSLVNGVAILSRYLPKKKFGRCEFGVTAADPVDCIQCDRCRYNVKSSIMEATSPHVVKQRVGPRFLAVCVVTAAVLVAGVSVSRFTIAMPSSVEPLASSAASGGKPRDVDTQRMRTLIREKKLSDKEADYYRKGE